MEGFNGRSEITENDVNPYADQQTKLWKLMSFQKLRSYHGGQ